MVILGGDLLRLLCIGILCNFMIILTFTDFYLPGYKGGGPIKTIKNLCQSVVDEIIFKVITSDRDLGDKNPYASVTCGAWNQLGTDSVFYAQPGIIGYVQIAQQLFVKNYDAVYLNSFFSLRFSFFPVLLAKALRQQVVLGPRGEFSEGALSLKPFKKRIFINLFMMLGLHRDTIFQASSVYEADDIRRTLGTNVDILVAEDIGAQEFADEIPPRTAGALKSVFISRISQKKNLLFALEVLLNFQQPLIFDIYGPIEDRGYWRDCEKVIATLPQHIQVNYKGVLKPENVVKILVNYDVFFFPTKGENYGHVISEALCAGLPILISDTTPWRNLQSLGIGWDLPLINPDAFINALEEISLLTPEKYYQLRQIVLAWAKIKFSQIDAVEANIALFKYALEKG